jgi:hypothetical protein
MEPQSEVFDLFIKNGKLSGLSEIYPIVVLIKAIDWTERELDQYIERLKEAVNKLKEKSPSNEFDSQPTLLFSIL